ncbi:MAG: hypothetical protein ACLRRH_05035 [Clostridium sp.]
MNPRPLGNKELWNRNVFLPQDELKKSSKNVEIILKGLKFLGWEQDPSVLGSKAIDCMPRIMQGFIKGLKVTRFRFCENFI